MRNHAAFCLHSLLYRLLLLTLDGAVLQTLLLECGFSEDRTGVFFSVMKMIQVAVILLLSRTCERTARVKRATALLFLGVLPLAILLLFFTLTPGSLAGAGTVLLYLTGGIYCVAIGAYNILSYKLPYTIMDMRSYGRVTGIASALGGGASLLLSLLLTLFQNRLGYLPTMSGAYLATVGFALLAVGITLSLRETAPPPPSREEERGTRLLAYRPFTLLILPNIARGFTSGVVAVIVTVGYTAGLLDASSASLVVVITGGISILGSLIYAWLASRLRSGQILLAATVGISLLLPMTVLFENTAAFLIFYGLAYFFVMQVDHAVPVAVTRFVSYGMISRYTAGRMLLHTLGTSLAGFVAVGICRLAGPLTLMLTAVATQLTFGIFYYLYLKKQKL